MKTSDRKILKGYYWNHDAIRKDMERLQKVENSFSKYSAEDFKKIAKWFNYHEQCILAHHHGEDDFFFPIMKERKPQFNIEIGKMEHEHILLDENLENLQTLFLRLIQGEKNLEHEFKLAAENYRNLVAMHLEQEEKIVETIVSDFPVDDITKTEEDYRKQMPRSQMALVMPWMVDAMDDKDKGFFFSMTPFFVKWIYNLSAKPKYEKLTGF